MQHKLFVITAFIFLFLIISYFGLKYFSPISSLLSGVNVKKYGAGCEYAGQCGNIVAINCRAEVDGPFYYIDKQTGGIVEYCGGYCMGDDPTGKYCQHCPPEGWSCK